MSFALEVTKVRPGVPGAIAFFDVLIGMKNAKAEFVPLITAKDFVLRKTNAGAYFFKPPAKLRTKHGDAVKDEKGYDIYDALIDVYIEKGAGANGGWGPTKASASVKNEILKQAVAGLEALQGANTGRGPSAVDGADDNAEDLPFN